MINFGVKKLAVVAAMVGAAAVASPALAAAEPAVLAPKLTVEDGDFAGMNLKITTENPNGPVSACVPLLVSGDTALKAMSAYSAGDTDALVDALTGVNSVRVGAIAYEAGVVGGEAVRENPAITTWQVEDGVHLLVGACKKLESSDLEGGEIDYKKLLQGGATAINIKPLVLPSGIGSISSLLSFGSAAMTVPGALDTLMELLEVGSAAGDAAGE